MRLQLLVIAAVVVLAACQGKPPPPPPPPPPTTTTTTTIPVDPFPPRTAPFTWILARGSSWFSGTSATPSQIVAQFDELKAEWTNLWPTVRTCAERARWPTGHSYLFKGPAVAPYDESSPAYLELERFLKVAASIPHAQVLLVPICTLKEGSMLESAQRTALATAQGWTGADSRSFTVEDGWYDVEIQNDHAFDINEKWVRTVCKLAARHENVAIEVINEWRHPNSIYAKLGLRQDQVIRMIKACREEAPNTQIGTDSNTNKTRTRYDPDILPFVDFLSFHPWRNPDPDEDEIRAMVRQRIGKTALSETTCFDFDSRKVGARGNCTGDYEQILRYQRDTERKGGVFVYHTKRRGLCDPRGDCGTLEPITPRGDHAIKHGL